MTYRELVYMVLDEIKAISNDSTITEEHVIFLANHYRTFLIQLKIKSDKLWNISTQNYQTICLETEATNIVPEDNVCSESVLKSVQEVPNTLDEDSITVYPKNYFANINIAYVSRERFKYVGYNKFMQNIIYATLGIDNHIYLKGYNPQFLHLSSIRVSALFEDANEAALYSCDSSDGSSCDILDADFALDSSMVPQLIELLVKELSAAEWRQMDDVNNSNDDLSNLVAYLAKNTKSSLAKQIEQ